MTPVLWNVLLAGWETSSLAIRGVNLSLPTGAVWKVPGKQEGNVARVLNTQEQCVEQSGSCPVDTVPCITAENGLRERKSPVSPVRQKLKLNPPQKQV